MQRDVTTDQRALVVPGGLTHRIEQRRGAVVAEVRWQCDGHQQRDRMTRHRRHVAEAPGDGLATHQLQRRRVQIEMAPVDDLIDRRQDGYLPHQQHRHVVTGRDRNLPGGTVRGVVDVLEEF